MTIDTPIQLDSGSGSEITVNINTCTGGSAAINDAATRAAASQAAAAASETAAAASAASAETSATAAAASASASNASALDAVAAAEEAAASATTATTAATAANASETAAATYAAQAQAAVSNSTIKVSATDTAADFLQGKLVAGANVGLTRNNAGGAETLTVAVTGLGTAASQDAAAFASAAQGSKADTALQPAVVDTDGTLAANSDALVASQKAVRTYVADRLSSGTAADRVCRQDAQQLYLMLARLNGLTAGSMASGVYDAFASDTLSGVSGTAGQSYDAVNRWYVNHADQATVLTSGDPGQANDFTGLACGDMAWYLPNGQYVTKIGAYSSAAVTLNFAIMLRISSNAYQTLYYSVPFSHPGGGWVDFTLPAPFLTPGSGTIYVMAYGFGSGANTRNGSNRAIISGEPSSVGSTYTVSEDTGTVTVCLRATYGDVPPTMTLVTPAATAATAPTRIDAEILWKDVAGGAVLNTDLILHASTDGGATWTAATLAATGNAVSGFAVLSASVPVAAGGTSIRLKLDTTTHSQQVAGYTLLWG